MRNCSGITWREQIAFDEMTMMSDLYETNINSYDFNSTPRTCYYCSVQYSECVCREEMEHCEQYRSHVYAFLFI
jgi:hypothetical protein